MDLIEACLGVEVLLAPWSFATGGSSFKPREQSSRVCNTPGSESSMVREFTLLFLQKGRNKHWKDQHDDGA